MAACVVTLKRPLEVMTHSPPYDHEPLSKRRRCGPPLFPTTPTRTKRAKRMLDLDEDVSPYSSPARATAACPFRSATSPLDTDKLAANVEAELKRLQRRKLYQDDATSMATSTSADDKPQNPSYSDQPLFTLKQVVAVCQHMLKEREERVREDYNKVLTTKLAEQYDAFVKFSHDQIEKRLSEAPLSYVS